MWSRHSRRMEPTGRSAKGFCQGGLRCSKYFLPSHMSGHGGEVALRDPVVKYLPPGTKMPERNGRSITPVDLATHTSGLPRLPTNMSPKDPNNPYADYSVKQLYEFLSTYQLSRDIGSQYEYSNLGGGLLGHALALRAGMSY